MLLRFVATSPPPAAPLHRGTADLGRLKRLLYLFGFVDEFGPIYAIYPLWFLAQGMTTSEISILYVTWAGVGLFLEVPSGALADRIDRRRLVACAVALRAIGIAAWMLWPTTAGIFTGAILWAIHTALASGAFEALVHDELKSMSAAAHYPVVMARLGQANHLGIALGTAASTGLLALGFDMPVAAWVTVGLHLPSIVFVLALPDSRVVQREGVTVNEWWRTLRAGTSVALRNRVVARLVILGCLLEGLFILDEYVHLLAKARGASDVLVPILVGLVWLGLLLGGEVAARQPTLSGRTLGAILSLGGALCLSGLLWRSVWGVAGIGVAYATLNLAWVLSDARLQAQIPSDTRATITSVRSLFSSGTEMAALGAVGLMATGNDPAPGLILLVTVLGAAGLLVARWVPD